MIFSKAILYFLTVVPIVFCAPLPLDAETLLENAQEAQVLNAAFKSLKASDECTTGQIACIGRSSAECFNGQWSTSRCEPGTQCFALPSVRIEGTIISCTSQRNALSVFNASGATGGVALAPGSDLSAPRPSKNPSTDQVTPDRASSAEAAAVAPSDRRATITVTITSTSFSTDLPAQTRTVAPAAASSLIASFSSATGVIKLTAAALATLPPSDTLVPVSMPVSLVPSSEQASDAYGYPL